MIVHAGSAGSFLGRHWEASVPEWVVGSGVRGKGGGCVVRGGGGGNQVVGATARNVILGKLESRAWEEVVRVVLRCAVVVDQIRQTAR